MFFLVCQKHITFHARFHFVMIWGGLTPLCVTKSIFFRNDLGLFDSLCVTKSIIIIMNVCILFDIIFSCCFCNWYKFCYEFSFYRELIYFFTLWIYIFSWILKIIITFYIIPIFFFFYKNINITKFYYIKVYYFIFIKSS